MVTMSLVVFSCKSCSKDVLAVKGEESYCPHCGEYRKKSYGNDFIVAVGGKKGLVVAPVKIKK